MSSPRIYGVDFSGSKTAGEKIWLASCVKLSGELFVEGCFPATELPESGRQRERCLAALETFIGDRKGAAFGLDFPFGLPAEITEYDDWNRFVMEFRDSYESPLDFYETCKATGADLPGETVEYGRMTDAAVQAPFSPYNWRIKQQTYFGIGTLLAGLVENDAARILPMQAQSDARPSVLEVCPSSTLRSEGLPHKGYKGSTVDEETTRQYIVEQLEHGAVCMTDAVRQTAIENPDGDALDSILAAVATARGVAGSHSHSSDEIEGHIYV